MLPPRRQPPRSGIERAPRRIFATHRAFVRRHACSIPGCDGSPIEFAHLRTAANSGVGLKPMDWFGISLCRSHHSRAHNAGHDTMARENGITLDRLFQLAAEFAKKSPDKAMHEAMRAEETADAI